MTKPQKIEGGWKNLLAVGIRNHFNGKPSLEFLMLYLEDFISILLSTEIEKAKASERQRCVEDCLEALPKEADMKIAVKTKSDVGAGWTLGFNACRDQAKHNLEQMK